jgi:hypothetical protein
MVEQVINQIRKKSVLNIHSLKLVVKINFGKKVFDRRNLAKEI